MAGSHDVFICHSFEDAPTARAICDCLETGGIRCWIAPRDPVAGIPYGKQLVDAIDGTHIVLLVFSAAANASQAVLNEIELASNRKKIVFPVRTQDVAPSGNLEFYIRSIHWFDAATQPLEAVSGDLLRHVKTLLERPQEQPAPASQKPALRPINAPRHNLPSALTSFVGRERETREVEESLQSNRLVTLAGTGGVGKTRCALRVGNDLLDRYRDGVWFVDLAEILDGSLVPATIAAVFDLEESPNRPMLDTLLAYLRNKPLLLIVDNCEHLIGDAAPVIQTILQRCPDVGVLATSREVLGIPGECVYRMPTLSEHEAKSLFVDRAQSAGGRFRLDDANESIVASICRRLDGIALAIELAAARAKTLSVAEIDRKLGERFRILTGGSRTALPRHQTLHAAIEWSYDLLSQPERALFATIAIFIGGFTLDLATAVYGETGGNPDDVIDVVSSLVDKSLLQANFTSDPTRYELLESTREYARQKLIEDDALESTVRAHALAYTQLASDLEAAWRTMPDSEWTPRAEAELPNWRPALRWALGMQRDVVLGKRLAAALRPAWAGLAPSEGLGWIRTGLEVQPESTPPEILAGLYLARAHLEMLKLEYRSAQDAADRALALFSELGDTLNAAFAKLFSGAALGRLGKPDEGEALLQSALTTFRERGARYAIAATLNYLGSARIAAGDMSARPFLEEALAIYKEIGALRPAAHLALSFAEVEFQNGDAEAALRLISETLDADRAYNAIDSLAFDLCNSSAYLVALERWDEAERHAREALTIARERQIPLAAALAIQHVAAAAALRNYEDSEGVSAQRQRAAKLLGFVDAKLAALGFAREYTERREYDAMLKALDEKLGAEDTARLMDDGRSWDENTAAREGLST